MTTETKHCLYAEVEGECRWCYVEELVTRKWIGWIDWIYWKRASVPMAIY